MRDRLHAVLEASLHHTISHLAKRGNTDRQPLRRPFGDGQLRQQPKGLVLVSLFPRLAEQGVEKLPRMPGAMLFRRILELQAEKRDPRLRAAMVAQDTRQHAAQLIFDLPIGLGVPAAAQTRGNLLPGLFFHGRIVGRNPVQQPLQLIDRQLADLVRQHAQGRLADAAALVRLLEEVMAHNLVSHGARRRMTRETNRRVAQRSEPERVDAIRIQVVALAEGLCHGGLEPGVDIRRQFVGRASSPCVGRRCAARRLNGLLRIADPLGDEVIGLFPVIVPHQGTQVMGVDILRRRVAFDPGGQVFDQVVVATLLLQQVGVGRDQGLLFIRQPFRRRHEHAIQPGAGRRVLTHAGQGPCVLLLEVVVVRIVGGKLFAQLDYLLRLPSLLQAVAA